MLYLYKGTPKVPLVVAMAVTVISHKLTDGKSHRRGCC